MANISTAIELLDRVSSPINGIISSISNMIFAYEDAGRAMSNGFDTAPIDDSTRSIEQQADEMDDLERNIEDTQREQENLNRAIQGGESAMDGLLGKATALVAAMGIGKIASEAIDFASDLQEVQNVVDVAFGNSSKTIDEWATTTLEAYGLNELSAKKFAGTLGAMLKSSGLSGKEVDEMSMKITELAGDMASFYNLEGEDAFGKLRAGISGETEPLKQLGINMSVANLEAYALSQGLETAYNEMSQSEQLMVRYNYLLQATSDAQGDFSRTVDSYSNQGKLLSENWKAFTGAVASNALPYLAGMFTKLNELISYLSNNMGGLVGMVETIASAISNLIDLAVDFAMFFSDNWSVIEPIVMGIVTALGLYYGAMLLYNTVTKASAWITAAKAFADTVHAASQKMAAGETFAATAAQLGFNAALLACPITWVVLGIIAGVVALVLLCNWIAKATGAANSGIGIIVGALTVAAAFIGNLFIALINFAIDAFVVLWNFIASFASFFATVFNDPVNASYRLFFDFVDSVLALLKGLASAIDALFGSDLAGSVQGWRDSLGEWVDEKYGKGTEIMAKLNGEDWHLDRFEYDSAWNAGVELGDSFGDGVGDALGNLDGDLSEVFDQSAYDDLAGEIPANIKDTAENTGAMSESMELSSEDLKYLRDIAERDVVNRFTTAEIKVEMTNNNNISSDMDLDGVVEYLVIGVNEALEKAAEGVHA